MVRSSSVECDRSVTRARLEVRVPVVTGRGGGKHKILRLVCLETLNLA